MPEDTPRRYRDGMEQAQEWQRVADWMGVLSDLDGAAAVLEWDRETGMPEGGAAARGTQLSTLAALRHRHLLDPAMEEPLAAVAESPDPWQAASARIALRDRARASRVPEDLVRALAEASSHGVATWSRARPADDVDAWIEAITPLIALTRQQATALADGGDPYDALLDLYEPGTTYAMVAPLFDALAARVRPLVEALDGAGGPALPTGPWDDAAQMSVARALAADIGFDLSAGVVGRTAHPVTMSLGPGDTRLSTRVDAADPLSCIMALLHEGGHAMYDQGLPPEHRRTLAGDAPSLGAHESQSRFWENHVGRTLAFWQRLAPDLATAFPVVAGGLGPDDYRRALNRVRTQAIRVESDEVTYDLHIILRTRLERALITGDLAPADLPAAFGDGMRELLGITPDRPANGAMQDIHWSAGIIGYFPTYTLGNLYAAALADAAADRVGPIDDVLREEGPAPLLAFLRDAIHSRGSLVEAPELMRDATGGDISVEPFIAHLERTYSPTSSVS